MSWYKTGTVTVTNGSAVSLSGSGSSYTVGIQPVSAGTVTVSVLLPLTLLVRCGAGGVWRQLAELGPKPFDPNR